MPKINELTRATALTGTDLLPMDNASGTATKAVSGDQIKAYVTGDVSAEVTDLKTQLSSNDWFNDAAKPLLMTGSGTWGEPDSTHICLDISSGDVVKVKANQYSPAVYGFLKSANNIASGDTIDYSEAEGFTSRIVLSANATSSDIVTPSDANLLCFNLKQGTENHCPISVIINGIEMIDSIRRTIKKVDNKIATLETSIISTNTNIKNKYDEIIIADKTISSTFDIKKLEFDTENYIRLKEALTNLHTNYLFFKNTKLIDIANADIKLDVANSNGRFVFKDVKENTIFITFYPQLVDSAYKLYITFYDKTVTLITYLSPKITIDFSNKYHNIKVVKIGYTYFCYFDNVYCGSANLETYIDSDIKTVGFGFRGDLNSPSYYKNEWFERIGSFLHFSFDDQITILKDITDNAETYTSIFDNTALAGLKAIHDKYGCVYTLELFQTNGTFNISNTTTKFKNEFKSNSEWLKFAYHGPDTTSYPGRDMTTEELVTSVGNMYTAIRNFAGENSIDKTPRMSYFNCTKEQALAMRENGLIVGLLTADDDRTENVGLDSTERAIMQNYDTFTDFDNKITYFRSELRMDNNTYQELIANYNELYDSWRNNKQFIVFGHAITETLLERVEKIAEWAFEHNMKFDYPQNYTMYN